MSWKSHHSIQQRYLARLLLTKGERGDAWGPVLHLVLKCVSGHKWTAKSHLCRTYICVYNASPGDLCSDFVAAHLTSARRSKVAHAQVVLKLLNRMHLVLLGVSMLSPD